MIGRVLLDRRVRSGDTLRGIVDGALDPLTFSGKVLIFMAFYEIARPLYRVKEYRDGLYKLIKFRNSDRTMVSLRDHKEDTHHDKKLEAAYSRARSVIQQLALCNKWDYLCFSWAGALSFLGGVVFVRVYDFLS